MPWKHQESGICNNAASGVQVDQGRHICIVWFLGAPGCVLCASRCATATPSRVCGGHGCYAPHAACLLSPMSPQPAADAALPPFCCSAHCLHGLAGKLLKGSLFACNLHSVPKLLHASTLLKS